MTEREPEWTEHDRALALALLAEEADACPLCGHPMSECRDRATAGKWQVHEEICQASRVSQAVAENNGQEKKPKRGLVLLTSRMGR